MRRKKTEDEDALTPEPVNRQRLTPADIQQAEFRLSMRGYNEREVDELLDRLTEDWGAALEENKRLREQGGSAPAAAAPSDTSIAEARREAEEIVARAKAEAATIVREARASAPSGTPVAAADVGAVSSFLTRERDFLQSLGRLVQGHAESVKSMAQSAKSAESKPAAPPAPVAPPAAAAPAPKPAQHQEAPERTPQPAGNSGPPTQPVVKIDAERDRVVPERASAAQAAPQARPAAQPRDAQPAAIRIPEDQNERAAAKASDRPQQGNRDEELSLRELFWGDE
jgi:DivIVA domain-containing protein